MDNLDGEIESCPCPYCDKEFCTEHLEIWTEALRRTADSILVTPDMDPQLIEVAKSVKELFNIIRELKAMSEKYKH